MKIMPDILVLWNRPLLWNQLFSEYGMSSSSALPEALLTSHLPPAKLILLPAGFMSKKHQTAAASFTTEKVTGKLLQFVENGGNLLAHSPKINEPASFSWLNLPITFVPESMPVLRKNTLLLDQESFFCDGWFQNADDSCIIGESDDKGRPIHMEIHKGKENGKIILSSIHEFLSKPYFLSLLNGPRVKI
jgi:hypothetical protein